MIQTLIEEERTNEKQFKDLTEALRLALISDSSKSPRSDTPAAALPPDGLLSAELRKYYLLVNKLVSDIDSFRSEMDQTQNRRVRKSVLLVHEAEVAQYYKTHGQAVGDIFRHQLCNLVDRYALLLYFIITVRAAIDLVMSGEGIIQTPVEW